LLRKKRGAYFYQIIVQTPSLQSKMGICKLRMSMMIIENINVVVEVLDVLKITAQQ